MSIQDLFEERANWTWESIKRFHTRKISLGEDAITSLNLDAIGFAYSSVVIEDTRVDESFKGCDFELWISTKSKTWRRYAVQAKKIRVDTSRYDNLNHKVSGKTQIDILDTYAASNKAMPVYCFYNYSNDPYLWNCALTEDVRQLGCSITPSSVVRSAIATYGGRSFKYIHDQKETLPWRCLVTCPMFLLDTSSKHIGWPDPSNYTHAELPKSLKNFLLQKNGTHIFIEPDNQGESLNLDCKLRPKTIVIIDPFEKISV